MSAFHAPNASSYDVVIIGGAMLGSSVAWFLSKNPDFDGRVLVVERDPSYEFASTSHTNSCMRQQFSSEVNIRISQFAADFVNNFRAHLGPEAPDLTFQKFGYMYLAADDTAQTQMRAMAQTQRELGAGTRYMSADEIAAAYPFYNLEDVLGGNHNLVDEGYFDGGTLFDWWRRQARARGVEYVANEVVAITRDGTAITGVTLATGEHIAAGHLVNAAGPRAAKPAQMAGFTLPVEPRKRYTFIFDAAQKLETALPLTIDPSGVHVRQDGQYFMAGCPPKDDHAVEFDDFEADHDLWQDKVWPALAHRIPAFEALRLINSWVGHYAYNTLDQNAIIGPHPACPNFIFVNGFSGHGLQQSPAMGRGVSELITYGRYDTLDLSPLSVERILAGKAFVEWAVI